MNKNLSGNYEANIARSPISMLMPQSIMNCTDLALFVSVTVNTFNSPSLSTGSLIFLLLHAAYAKKRHFFVFSFTFNCEAKSTGSTDNNNGNSRKRTVKKKRN